MFRYIARHGASRVAKAVLISAVPPIMVKTESNPGGLSKEVFDGLQAQVADHRSQFYLDLPTGPLYGFNRPGARLSAKLLKNGTLKTYKGFPHGMPTTEAATINADLLTLFGAKSPAPCRRRPWIAHPCRSRSPEGGTACGR
jgi:hypothetical protein